MASSSKESAVKVINLIGKRGLQDDLETEPFLKKPKGTSEDKEETTEGFADDSLQREEVAVRKKTLYFGNFPLQTNISDIVFFFKILGGVVRVQLVISGENKQMGHGFVEFASADIAKKALQNNNGEYFGDSKILLDVDSRGAVNFPPKFCVDYKSWRKRFHPQEKLAVYKLFQEVTSRKTTLFVSNLSPQTELRDVIDFVNYYGGLVRVRLIVNHEGKHVGYGFVEFANAKAAQTLLIANTNWKYLHDHKIFLSLATRIKKKLGKKLRYRGEILRLEEDEAHEEVDVSNKTLFVGNFSPQTEISHIINFFKDVGEVVHVRLFVDLQGKHVGYGFVDFASTNESRKALDHKYGECLHGRKIFLDLANKDCPHPPRDKYLEYLREESLPIEEDEIMKVEYPLRPMCCIDYNVWYEDYLRQESLLREEEEEEEEEEDDDDETIEGLVEEVARRKKTLFVTRLARRTEISDINWFFKDVAEVVGVRLIIDDMGEQLGCGFVEFASVNEAKKALQKKNGMLLCGSRICLDVVKIAPYTLQPKYKRAEKLWSIVESNLMKEEDDLDTKPELEKQKEKETVIGMFCGKKTTFSDDDSCY